MKFLIVIPTYNEIQNLKGLTEAVFQVVDSKAHLYSVKEVNVLVVDDNSPDGTGKLADELGKETFSRDRHTGEPRLHVLHRSEKNGLGKAYVAGFAWALDRGYDAVLEMDADFSHNPSYLPEFWRLLKEHDVVMGSRYVNGGGVRNWGLVRQVISRGGSVYARAILGMPVNDMTGGYNAWKRNVLEAVDISTLRSEGYAFQIELKWRAWKKGFRLTEFPILFEDRTRGKSKMSKKIIVEAMMRVASMKRLMNKKSKLFAYRGPMYFGGLLLGLAAGVGFYKAKKAMMPKFHEQQDTRPEAVISPGGTVRFSYGGDDPGYFLIYGMPTAAALYRKNQEGNSASLVTQLGYRELTDKEPSFGPIPDEGNYNVDADFYICAEPGVADCTKLNVTEDIRVDRNAPTSETKIELNLPKLAQDGLKDGDMENGGSERNKVSDKDIEEKKEKGSD